MRSAVEIVIFLFLSFFKIRLRRHHGGRCGASFGSLLLGGELASRIVSREPRRASRFSFTRQAMTIRKDDLPERRRGVSVGFCVL